MKKKAAALLCAVLLMLQVISFSAGAASGGLFFLSINDTMPVLTEQTGPIQYKGWVYVPVNVFSSSVTGVNFGIYYGVTSNESKLIFYNLSGKNLTYDLTAGTCSANVGEAPQPGEVLKRNGVYYVSAFAICQYFGLIYSLHTTDYGPLLRIKDSSAVLTDQQFIYAAASLMRGRLYEYNQANKGSSSSAQSGSTQQDSSVTSPSIGLSPSGTGQAAGAAPAQGAAGAQEEAPSPFRVSLGISVHEGDDITALLDVLAAQKLSAVVFFPADSVASCADQMRQAIGRGHCIGLVPYGNSAEARAESYWRGAMDAEDVLFRDIRFILGTAPEGSGCLSWREDCSVNLSTDLRVVRETGAARRDTCRVLISGGMSSASLAGILRQLVQDGDTFLAPRETRY